MRNPLAVGLMLILLFAILFRFASYQQRMVFNQDQARDAIIANYAINEKILPPIGPPSSAGPFSFGPIYYWVIIFFVSMVPFVLEAPWIGFTLLSAVSVLLLFFMGKRLHGMGFALILGLIIVFASLEVKNSSDMLNPMLVGVATTLAFFSLVELISGKKLIFSIVLGLSVGLAINFHFQALGLLGFLGLAFLINDFNLRKKILAGMGMFGGLVLAFVPLILFDLKFNGVWIVSIYNYLTTGQNKFYIPIRWLTEIRDFWPQLWGEIITAFPISGYFLIGLFLVALILALKKKQGLSKTWWVIFLTFLVQIILLRYYKGPRLSVYLIVYYPFIIFLTAWSLWMIWKSKKIVGLFLLFGVLILASYSNYKIIANASGQTPIMQAIKKDLTSKKDGKVEMYQYSSSGMLSMPMFYLLSRENRVADGGFKLGVCENITIYNCPQDLKVLVQRERFIIFNLNDFSEDETKNRGFSKVDSKEVYDSIFVNFPNAKGN